MRLQLLQLSTAILVACSGKDRDPWNYPVRLGMSREEAHHLLGQPERSPILSSIEDFPSSGVSLAFDSAGVGTVTSIYFDGNKVIDHWIPSTHEVAFGVTPQSSVTLLFRQLGGPVQSDTVQAEDLADYTWRRSGYLIHVRIWVRDTTEDGHAYRAGTINYMMAKRAI